MARPLLVVILTIILVGTWGSLALARDNTYSISNAYNLDRAERGFAIPSKVEPSASVVAADAVIGRPVGLATTIAGTGVFILTLPFSLPSRSVDTASWGLVGRPGGWTFVRPLGRNAPEFEEKSVFGY
jgi:hypothetical protein